MKKRWKMIGVVCAIAILSAGCKSKESEAPTPSSTQDVPAETAETEYQPEPVETLIQTGQLLFKVLRISERIVLTQLLPDVL